MPETPISNVIRNMNLFIQ